MSFSFFRGQLAEVIQWKNPQPSRLLWKFPSAHDEIKDASQLLVGPGQGVLLMYEGRVLDVLEAEGLYHLGTDNQPFITTLLKLHTGFESEHKLYRRADNVNQPWGTATLIKYLDPGYRLPVELGAHGNFSWRLADARRFFYGSSWPERLLRGAADHAAAAKPPRAETGYAARHRGLVVSAA